MRATRPAGRTKTKGALMGALTIAIYFKFFFFLSTASNCIAKIQGKFAMQLINHSIHGSALHFVEQH